MPNSLQPDPAQGVFETMLVVAGAPVEPAAHLARLRRSVHEVYGAELPAGAATLVTEHAAGLRVGRLRLTVAPDDAAGLIADAVARPIDPAVVLPPWARALDLRSAAVADWCGAHKWADRRLLDTLDRRTAPAGALLVDPTGAVLETTRANVFAAGPDGVAATPPADGAILPGIARERVMAMLFDAGVAVAERRLMLDELRDATEVFVTGSVRGVEPVRSLDGVAVPGPGELTRLAATRLRGRWLGQAAG